MPNIHRIACELCGFGLSHTYEVIPYIILDDGRRLILGHPFEKRTALHETGRTLADLERLGRVGAFRDYLCLHCRAALRLDPNCDALVCPECASVDITPYLAMDGRSCPRCFSGRMKRERVGVT